MEASYIKHEISVNRYGLAESLQDLFGERKLVHQQCEHCGYIPDVIIGDFSGKPKKISALEKTEPKKTPFDDPRTIINYTEEQEKQSILCTSNKQ